MFLNYATEMWKAAHAGGHEQCPIDSEARELLGSGLCQVVALLPKDDRLKGFEHLLSLPQDELGRQSQKLDETRDENSKNLCLRKVAGEIRLIAVLCRSFTNAATVNEGSMESGCPSSPDRRELVSPPVMTIVRRSWPKIVQLASTHSCDEVSFAVGKKRNRTAHQRCIDTDVSSSLISPSHRTWRGLFVRCSPTSYPLP